VPVDLKTLQRRAAKARDQGRGGPGSGGETVQRSWLPGRRVGTAALAQFTSQLAILQNAGLPVVRSLRILAGQMRPGYLRSTITRVYEDVEGGGSLSESLSKHPGVFDPLYVSMVKAGEAGGVLDVILERLSGFKEKDLRLRRQIRSASIYPLVVLMVALGVLLLVMTVVVPKFRDFFSGIGEELPRLTQIILDAGVFCQQRWYVLLLVPVILFAIFRLILRTEGGRLFFDRLKLRLPVFGMVARKSAVARFTRTLSTLLESGVPILEALSIVKSSMSNRVLEIAVESVSASIREGESMARPLGESGQFDDILVNMVDVGERTGEMDRMLSRIADSYESDVDNLVKTMSSLLEPFLIVAIGGIVFIVILSLFLPLVRLMDRLGTS
jgi:type IV pilus assembly protein PilC